MFFKKLGAAVLTTAMLLGAVPAVNGNGGAAVIAYAKDNVSFYAGDFYGEDFYRKKVKVSKLQIPTGFSCNISTSDKGGKLTTSDQKAVSLLQVHNYQEWRMELLKEKDAVLSYQRGKTKSGNIELKALPELKFTAAKKTVNVVDGKVKLSVKYTNHTKEDIVIEGLDINWCQISFDKTKPNKERAIEKPQWIVKKVTIPAGKSKTVTLEKKASRNAKVTYCDYPRIYFQYAGVHFLSYVGNSKTVAAGEYYDKMSFHEFLE